MQKIKSKKYEIHALEDALAEDKNEPFAIWIRDRASKHAIRIGLEKKEIRDFWNEWKVHHK